MDVFNMIAEQQKGHANSHIYWVGEQLKDIIRETPGAAEIVAEDLGKPEMGIREVERKICAYAKKHGGCTPPKEADKIIREFYGIRAADAAPAPGGAGDVLDLTDFL